jgi:LacI family transcriptional regulator
VLEVANRWLFESLADNLIANEIVLRTDSEDLKMLLQKSRRSIIDAILLWKKIPVAALKFGLKMDIKFEELSIIGFADGILASRRLTQVLTVSQHAPEIVKEAITY